MANKRIGLLFGMEDTFPWALIDAINSRGAGVEAAACEISFLKDDGVFPYDLILDRISHEVLFYRTYLKCAAASGVKIVNNPIWWSADDKFFDNLVAKAAGVAVPKTVLLPHKEFPPNTEAKSFRNMQWVDWDEVFRYLGWPIFMKPAYGGGWKDVYKVHGPDEFFATYDQSRDLVMMAQEAIEFDSYYRCYVLGREHVRIMVYDPRQPHHLRYVADYKTAPELEQRIHRDALALCEGLGYDMNTVEFAVRGGIPYAIDFMNCAPDADLASVGQENFDWMVSRMADVLINMVKADRKLELTGELADVVEHVEASIPADLTDFRVPCFGVAMPVGRPSAGIRQATAGKRSRASKRTLPVETSFHGLNEPEPDEPRLTSG